MSTSNNAINNTIGASISGVTNTLTVTNPSNTASSAARTSISVGGSSAADPSINFNVSGANDWEMGIDNNDSDKLKISQGTALGTNDTWIMTTAGERTMPLQPAFRADKTGFSNNVTGDGTTYQVIFDNTLFDQNSDYDNTTGLFTAPVNGIYAFYYKLFFGLLGAAHNVLNLDFTINGAPSGSFYLNPGAIRAGVTNDVTLNGSNLFQLSASDTLGVSISVSGSTKTVRVGGSDFSGCLVC